MVNKILLTFAISDFLFLLGGGLLIGFAMIMQNQMTQDPTLDNVATNLLLSRLPLTGRVP
jgi:hypothetical protein